MMGALFRLPLILALSVLGAAAMLVPAVFAATNKDWDAARAFLYSCLGFLTIVTMIALAIGARNTPRPARAPLIDLLTAFTVLPLMFAVPLAEILPQESFLDLFFEMVSCLTTTGATVFHEPDMVSDTVHLWRALVGWLGGLLMWVMAIAILGPMGLGGFEVLGRMQQEYSANTSQIAVTADRTARLRHYTGTLAPVYAALTVVLWIGLYLAGDPALVALCHAMSTLATSGISPMSGPAPSGAAGEGFILLFLVFALTRRTFTNDGPDRSLTRVLTDAQLRLGLGLAAAVTALLFLRHFVATLDAVTGVPWWQALWGAGFTVMSFLTTTGFESTYWPATRDWSGLGAPGITFIGLALVGGGVATTAGGVKLLRVLVLYRHGRREIEQLVHPSSVGRIGRGSRATQQRGAFMAWIFFMLFMVSIASVMLALSLTGLGFEEALILAVAALSTTGPLVGIAAQSPLFFADLSGMAKLILAASMVLGRLEALAIISLLNPEFWRS